MTGPVYEVKPEYSKPNCIWKVIGKLAPWPEYFVAYTQSKEDALILKTAREANLTPEDIKVMAIAKAL